MANLQKIIEIFTDGACSGNPGPGGWGAILRYGAVEKELNGGELDTTNNRMEMLAAIKALEALKKPSQVKLYTDSQYLQQGVTKWMKGWKAKNWPAKIKNQDLWRQIDALVQVHEIEWIWVRGHDGHAENERADALARAGVPKSV